MVTAILGPESPAVGVRGPSGGPDGEMEVAHAIAEELIDAITSKDKMAVWEALKAAFTCMESMPHDEYEKEG